MKITVDNDKPFVALLTERFPKAFDCLSQYLLLTKLNTYGFNKIAIRFIHNCLPNKKQQIRINIAFNTFEQ